MKLPGTSSTVVVILALIAAAAVAPAIAYAGPLTIVPERVAVGLFYDGIDLDIRLELPAGCDAAAVRLTGRAERLELKKKGKIGGVLWMSVGEVTFEDVPSVYLLATSGPLEELAPPEVLAHWKLGYHTVISAPPGDSTLLAELVKLKENDHLFAIAEGGLRPSGGARDDRGSRVLTGSFQLPARAPAGEYLVELFAFQDRQGVPLASARVTVEQVGIVRTLNDLAVHHGLLYGIAAVISAVAVGLLTGLIFSGKSGGVH